MNSNMVQKQVGTRKWLRIALPLSLVLNMFLLAFLGGKCCVRHRRFQKVLTLLLAFWLLRKRPFLLLTSSHSARLFSKKNRDMREP